MHDYIKIIHACPSNWYKDYVGQRLRVRSTTRYKGIGVQVFRPDKKNHGPDVIMDGDYEFCD